MLKKILVLGSNGMAGHVLTLMLRDKSEQFQVCDISRTDSQIHPNTILDITDFDGLRSIITRFEPDVVINCIGLLNQIAEDTQDQAILINSYLPHFLEKLETGKSFKLIHISTDCVFSGRKGGYKEDDFKDGVGFYAQTKSLGEVDNPRDLTIRTSIVGPELKDSGTGLFNWFAKQNGKINGYPNAFWTGVTTIELAKAILSAIEQDLCGLYHLVYPVKISKYDLLKIFRKEFNQNIVIEPYKDYKVDKSLVNSRSDFKYLVPSYEEMIAEMKNWILNHKDIYSYPHFLEKNKK